MDFSKQELQKSRNQLYNDFFNNKLPKRLPVSFLFMGHLVAEYGGENIVDFQFDYSKLEKSARKICDMLYQDACPLYPVGMNSRPPRYYQFLDAQSFVMGKSGFVQHPEVSGMMENEYPDLIKDPYAFIIEKAIPRQYKALNAENPFNMAIALQRAKADLNLEFQNSVPFIMDLIDDYGYYSGPPMNSCGFTEAPYDYIADLLRSFSGISMDIRRRRAQLKEACEAMLPLMFRFGLPENPAPEGMVGCPLHMPTFMREKDFEEIWMPSFKTMVEQYAAKGVRISAFCEDDWMRYLDYLSDLPAGSIFMFEYGDPQKIKDKLGNKFILQGLYPLNLIKTGSKQQCVDKAKHLLDIMMPGGGYLFAFDKAALTLSDVNMENFAAVAEFIRDYAVYSNAGENFGVGLNNENFQFDHDIIKPMKSKYLFDWDAYKLKYPLTPDFARAELESIDTDIFKSYMNMLA